MIDLKNVTLIAVDCCNYGTAVSSLQKSMSQCSFGAVKFLTDSPLNIDGIETVLINTLKSKDEYSDFIIRELYKYFDTDYVLITQHDSWVLNGDSWDDDFYNYDVIGAAWLYTDGRNVSNGGFSLRTKKLQTILATDENIEITFPEDEIIGRLYRNYLIKNYDIEYPTDEVADKFSFELRQPIQKTFGFHGYFHRPFKEHIVLKRSGALGDIVMLEPVMRYFNDLGYQIVMDIPASNMSVFAEHYFPVMHIANMNQGIVPIRTINFDMAYEVLPKQSVLKSYYDVAGIKDGLMINSLLNINRGGEQRFFDKYVLIHCDYTEIPHRDVNELDWHPIVKHLEKQGYKVFQVGNKAH